MRKIKSLWHISMPANNWDNLVNFYVNVCGFDQAFIVTVADMKKMFGKPVEEGDEETPRITYVRITPTSYLEISDAKVQGLGEVVSDPESPLYYFTLAVDDIEYTAKYMAEAGYPFMKDPNSKEPVEIENMKNYIDEDGCIAAWMEDPEGHLIKVIQQDGNTAQEVFEREHLIAE